MSESFDFSLDSEYIRPVQANELMKAAQAIKRTVYVYGATGFGKTSFVIDFLARKNFEYYPVSDDKFLSASKKDSKEQRIVVTDNLHELTYDESCDEKRAVVEELIGNMNVWLIMISRAPMPAWLKPLCIRRNFVMINEQELTLSQKEEESYFSKCGVTLLPKSSQHLREIAYGYPLALKIAGIEFKNIPKSVKNIESRQAEELSAIDNARKNLYDYLEYEVYNQWSEELYDFLMELSIVDSFDLYMARQITKRNDTGKLLTLAQETGSFISEYTKNEHTVYELRPALKYSMRKILYKKRTYDFVNRLYYSAGTSYELQERIPEALDMYEKCHSEDDISRLLIANAEKHAGSGHYWELRKYYFALSEEIIGRSPVLMAGMSLLQSIVLNDEESERWYNKLTEFSKHLTGSMKKVAKARLFYLDIVLPQRGTVKMTDILKQAWMFITESKTILPEMSLTNNQPSMMNGGKDFCEWSKHDRELAASIGKPVEKLMGSFGKGLVSLALAESFFEKGGESGEICYLAQKGYMQASTGGGKPELTFVAVGLLAWQSVLNNRINDAKESLESFRKSIVNEAPQLLSGIDTFMIQLLLYTGKTSNIDDLTTEFPDEEEGFCTLDRYKYITKVRVYLSQDRKEKAINLLQRLLLYASKRQRTYLYIESLVLLSITKFRMGEKDYIKALQDAVSRAEEYHFVRILTKEGAALYPILNTKELVWKDTNYKKQVMKECEYMAKIYPAYLSAKQNNRITLSDKALAILRMQAQGKSVDSIANELYLSRSGVKYYIQDTYKKLGVNNKAAAINEARNRQIL